MANVNAIELCYDEFRSPDRPALVLHIDKVITALSTRLDGTAAAASSVRRNARIMNLVMAYAIRHNYLKANPLPKGKGERTAPKVAQAIDKRCLLNGDQVAKMLDRIGRRLRRGPI